MTVAELIAELQKLPQDAEVWLEDSEWGPGRFSLGAGSVALGTALSGRSGWSDVFVPAHEIDKPFEPYRYSTTPEQIERDREYWERNHHKHWPVSKPAVLFGT